MKITTKSTGNSKFLRVTISVTLLMTALVAQAEHLDGKLNLSSEQRETLREYIEILDVSATISVAFYLDKSDSEIIKMTQKKVTDNFKDPHSAKFRNERVVRRKIYPRDLGTGDVLVENDGVYVCGEVNGKNSFGAYVGYRYYWGTILAAEVESGDNEVLSYVMLHYCSQ